MYMKVLLMIVASLAWNHPALGQSKEGATQVPAPASRKLTAEQNAELTESQRLTLEVIKLYNQQKYDEALPLANRAVEIAEGIFGAEDQHVAVALRNLAELYVAQRKYQQAEPLFLRAISIDDKTLPRMGIPEGSTINRYSCLLYETRPINEAAKAERELYERRIKQAPAQSAAEISKAGLTGGVLNGRAIRLPPPAYPPEAKQMRAVGVVRVQVLIDETGKVIEAKVLCGPSIFAKASLKSAYESRFTPTRLSGVPVKVNGIVVYNFQK
jgi:TonB family protein